MTRSEFMRELDGLLLDVSVEERESVLRYYEDYFEDAGAEKESDIIAELGSPEKLASIIKAELDENNNVQSLNGGIYTENGYKSTNYHEDKYEVIRGDKLEDEKESHEDDTSRNTKDFYHQEYNQNNGYEESSEHTYRYSKGSNIILFVILGILAIPIGLPILGSLFAVTLALVVTIICLFAVVFIVGIAFVLSGIVTTIVGLTMFFSIPANGVMITGTGLVLLGLGIILSILGFQLCKVVIPAIVRGIASICKIPFRDRRAMA